MPPSVANVADVNANGIKTLLANGVSKFFISGKPDDVNGLRNLRNSLSWMLRFLVVSFSKISLFS